MEGIIIIFVIIAVINSFARAAKKKADAEREAQRRQAQRQWQPPQPQDTEGSGYDVPDWRQSTEAEGSNYAEPQWQQEQPLSTEGGDYSAPESGWEQANSGKRGMAFEQDVPKRAGRQGEAYVSEAGMYEGAPVPKGTDRINTRPSAPPMKRSARAMAKPSQMLKLKFDGNSVVQGVIYSELLTRVTPGTLPYMRNR